MARGGKELGQRSPYTVKVGESVDRLLGMDRENDPAAMADAAHHLLENIRIEQDGIIINRGGQAKLNTVSIGVVEGIFDAGDIGAAV